MASKNGLSRPFTTMTNCFLAMAGPAPSASVAAATIKASLFMCSSLKTDGYLRPPSLYQPSFRNCPPTENPGQHASSTIQRAADKYAGRQPEDRFRGQRQLRGSTFPPPDA